MTEYPYFVQTKEDVGDRRFVSSYMSKEDVETIKAEFPNGCFTVITPYTVRYNGFNTQDMFTADRVEFFKRQSARESDPAHFWLAQDYRDLLHKGYQVLWNNTDDNYHPKIKVVKGIIRPNRDTVYQLLASVPKIVQAVFDAAWLAIAVPILDDYAAILEGSRYVDSNDAERI